MSVCWGCWLEEFFCCLKFEGFFYIFFLILVSQSTVSPKPTIDIDWLEMLSVTAFVLEVAFSPRGVNRADVVPVHHLGKVSIFLRVLKWHKIHASLATKVPVWKVTNEFSQAQVRRVWVKVSWRSGEVFRKVRLSVNVIRSSTSLQTQG